ncbi:hypothetical protein D0Z00_002508 [Geotrichum galactomycetum]|uniref:Uncharacterized protein n=1 Tax=Geotrichum galactomycetum TaxID=27317 RepID=A0ACB6V3V2_9ASCO|nr:hypothetical protein D0Z00_002508 [Geotrichum candidum]
MLNSTGSVNLLLRINILLEDATLYLHIEDSSKNWPYAIQNYTNHSLTVFQSNPYVDAAGYIDTSIKVDFKPIEYTIPAKSSVPYAWDFPAGIVRELVIKIEDQDRRVQFAEIGTLEPMKLGKTGQEVLDFSVVADGPTQILMITEIEGPLSAYQLAAAIELGTSEAASSSSKKNKKFDEGEVSMIVRVNMEGMGISLINKHMQELCYTTHALNGITSGANSFVEGITSGVSGLALAPVQGASEEGAMGFFKGLGKGLIGLPTKTAIGLLDMASSVSEGVRNTTTLLDAHSISRIRPPRFIARDGIIRPYDHDEAEAQVWLKTANRGQYYNDQYISHIPLACDSHSLNAGKEKVVIITYSRIILLKTSLMTTEWEVRFEELQAVTMERTGLALTLRGGVQGPFVPLRNSTDRKKMYNEIGVAVTEFNKKLR